ncbi:MAG TPA: bi-domain-containing oxidoreductase [Anaerolineales bacterium]|nr:bi-domain-containing oxidoreductase [Anaerolineales bacterium]
MKQVTQNMRDGKTSVQDVPIPTPTRGQALVRVEASLVSAGTERMLVEFGEKSLFGKARSRPDLVRQVLDKVKREGVVPTLEATFNRLNAPMALGYSSAGVIVELGPGMESFHVGQRVACAGGGYASHAEYNIIPQNLLAPIPQNVSTESAAFTTLGAISLHGFRLTESQINDNVAVIGLGLLGLLTSQIAQAAGCRVFGIDTQSDRVELAKSFGIQAEVRDQAEVTGLAFTKNIGFDSVIICADTRSNDPIELAGALARDRAKIVATGAVDLSFPRKVYYEKELSFINSRSYGPGRYDPAYEDMGVDYPIGFVRWTEGRNFAAIIDLISKGSINVEKLISHRFQIEQAAEAYELITGKTNQRSLGVLINYPNQSNIVSRVPISFQHSKIIQKAEVRLGVIGAGLFANATLLPRLEKVNLISRVGISSNNGLNASHSAKKFGFQYATSGSDQILNDENINTVAILTRHNSHADLAVKALTAGKNVFVEKPLALNSEELNALQKAISQENSPILMVGYNRRFSPHAIKLREFFTSRSEAIFIRYTVNAGFIPQNHWVHDPQIGGGRIIGETCHFIDLLSYLIDSTPLSVNAVSLPDSGKYHQDNVSITIHFEDGSLGVVDYLANGDRSFPKERVEVFCEGKIGILNDFRELTLIKGGNKQIFKDRFQQDKGHTGELFVLAESVKSGIPPIPYHQLFATSKVTFAALHSLDEDGKRIQID